jgi:lipopolysaccharide transport system permease protein
MPALRLALHFVRREVRSRYLGSFSGGLWALLQPLIQLAVYSVVFIYVFHAPVPGGDAGAPGYVPFLVMGLWPWNAFADALGRATTVIQENAALIGKVALPREVLVFATVMATFLVQAVGFCAITIALRLFGVSIDFTGLPLALAAFAQLAILALGFGLLFAAVQVFVRDLAAALPQLLMLWMFASPVFYARSSLPERYQGWLDWNPITHYTETFRAALLDVGSISVTGSLAALAVAVAVLALGLLAFRRLEPHFEDFL